MKREEAIRLRKYRDAAFVPLSHTDPEKWPMRAGRVGSLVLDEFTKEFFADIDCLVTQGEDLASIARRFENPSRLLRMSHHVMKGLHMVGLSTDEVRRRFLQYLDIVRVLKADDEFNEAGANVLMAPEEQRLQWGRTTQEAAPATAERLHRCLALLWAYSETLYFVAHAMCVEMHGPYVSEANDDDVCLVVRDYRRFSPVELWPQTEATNMETIRVSTVYRDVDVVLDIYNNPYLKRGSLPECLTRYSISIDGRASTVQELEDRLTPLGPIILGICQVIESMTERQVAEKYADVFWWRKRELRDAVGEGWRPPPEILKRIREGEIPPAVAKHEAPEVLRRKLDLTVP